LYVFVFFLFFCRMSLSNAPIKLRIYKGSGLMLNFQFSWSLVL